MITITENAAQHLRDTLLEKAISPAEKGLRLVVERGGCAGMQYTMRIAEPQPGDTIIESGGVRFFVDPASEPHLRDSRVDYIESLTDSGFKIDNPNASRSCGCGSSFEPGAPGQAPATDPSMDGENCGDSKGS